MIRIFAHPDDIPPERISAHSDAIAVAPECAAGPVAVGHRVVEGMGAGEGACLADAAERKKREGGNGANVPVPIINCINSWKPEGFCFGP